MTRWQWLQSVRKDIDNTNKILKASGRIWYVWLAYAVTAVIVLLCVKIYLIGA